VQRIANAPGKRKVGAMKKTTSVSHFPGEDWVMVRGKKAMAATRASGRVSVGIWKELPRARGALVEWRDGQELRLTPEEAIDLAIAIASIARGIDPDAERKHRRWVKRGRRRAPTLKVIRGGLRGDVPARAVRFSGSPEPRDP
jgi:hypothetical protein